MKYQEWPRVNGEVVQPTNDNSGVPWCDERCGSWDGKRCRVLGARPVQVCVPAVIELASQQGTRIARAH